MTEKIKAVTPADVLRVSQRFFNPKEMKIVVVGNAAQIKTDLTELGPVTVIPLESIE